MKLNPKLDKKVLRASLSLERKNLDEAYVQAASKASCEKILASDLFSKAHTIMAYLAFSKELSCDEVIRRALACGKKIYVTSIINKEEMLAAELLSLDNLVLDRYGIRTVREPIKSISPEAIDLILVPGLAFGIDGSRLGLGAGYYDRFLARTHAVTLGLCYKKLMQEALPMKEHDIFMQNLVNEEDLWSVKNI